MLKYSTIQLLRFHFSLFLLPVYLFALSQVKTIQLTYAVLVFIILHVLVYPSSNGYNSYMDRDKTPIGGLKNPVQPTTQLFVVTVFMDMLAIVLSLFVSIFFAVGIILYIAASRAYSYRKIRLKKYPVVGFITVMLFQGACIFFITYHAVHPQQNLSVPLLPCVVASCLIGALYPLTQIYQHREDVHDGVYTISWLVGKRGTFILSAVFFLLATVFMFIWWQQQQAPEYFSLFMVIMLPVVLFFLYWFYRVWMDAGNADFINSLRMNMIATVCSCIYFLVILIQSR